MREPRPFDPGVNQLRASGIELRLRGNDVAARHDADAVFVLRYLQRAVIRIDRRLPEAYSLVGDDTVLDGIVGEVTIGDNSEVKVSH